MYEGSGLFGNGWMEKWEGGGDGGDEVLDLNEYDLEDMNRGNVVGDGKGVGDEYGNVLLDGENGEVILEKV